MLSDYLIDPQDYDWSALLADWSWLLPPNLAVWMVNRFGDLIFVPEDGTVRLLDVGAGSVHWLAASRDDFCMKIDQGDNADSWLLMSLTDKCVAAGLTLEPGQCYAFLTAPVFGGKFELENVVVREATGNYRLLGQIHRQIKDLPDGARVRLVLDT